MKKIKHISWVSILLLVTLIISSYPYGAQAETKASKVAEGNAIGIGTGSVGSTFYTVGGGFANIWKILGVRAAVEVTGGSLQNAILVDSGQMGSALASQGAVYQAWNAIGLFEGEEKRTNLRAALPIQPSYIHGWTLEDDINSYRDLEGKIVSGGPAGGTSEEYNKAILKSAGINPRRFINAGFSDTTGQLADGLLDAVFCSMGVPTGSASEAAATHGAKIIGVDVGDFEKAEKELPFLVREVIPAGTYPNQNKDIQTLADINVYWFNKDVPENIVYEFVKASFENREMLVNTFAGLKAISLENVKKIRLPLHPGAYKYYKEVGADIPEAIIPESHK